MKEYLTGSIKVFLTLDFQSEVEGFVDGDAKIYTCADKLSRFMVCTSAFDAHDSSDCVHVGNFYVSGAHELGGFANDMIRRVEEWCDATSYNDRIRLSFYNTSTSMIPDEVINA